MVLLEIPVSEACVCESGHEERTGTQAPGGSFVFLWGEDFQLDFFPLESSWGSVLCPQSLRVSSEAPGRTESPETAGVQ